MNMATKEEMDDLDFEARRELPAFKPFPLTTTWPGEKPEIPEGFRSSSIGSGFSGLAMAVQLRAARHPLHRARASPGARWDLEHQPLSRHPGRHALHHLRVHLREGVPLERVLRSGRGGPRIPRPRLQEVRRPRQHPLRAATSRPADWDDDRNVWVLEDRRARRSSRRIEANVVVGARAPSPTPGVPEVRGRRDLRGPGRPPVPVAGRHSTSPASASPSSATAPPASSSWPPSPPRPSSVYVFQRTPAVDQPRAPSTARRSSPRSAGCSTTSRATGTGGATWPSPRSSAPTASSSPTRSGRPRAARSTR